MRTYTILFIVLLLGTGCERCLLNEKDMAFMENLNFKNMTSEDYLAHHSLISGKIAGDLRTYTLAGVTLKHRVINEDDIYSYETDNDHFQFYVREIPDYMREHFTDYATYYAAVLASFEVLKTNEDVCSLSVTQHYYLADRFLMHFSPSNNVYLPSAGGPIVIETASSNKDSYKIIVVGPSDSANYVSYGSIRIR
ncbi:hypothetical protein [Shewanella colwelliana]|uniref:hypothetical protein n=1 Tax=Shewanella colwelliana TaxID=23 RepID=UPI001C7D091A|nr:hypothetical protein [Shewanella colwelliana]